jgi:UDPglucose 6-dehydrogenase
MKIGFIGQGFVGKNIANDIETRGYDVVRYALEPEYVHSRSFIPTCDIVFIAVPTPTTAQGFDFSIVEQALALVGEGKIAVVKSTLIPGTTDLLQGTYPERTVLFSPEFLCEATAAHDAAHPLFNIIGIPQHSARYTLAAETVMTVLPPCVEKHIIPARSAELFKYVHNMHGFMRVVFSNLFHDAAAVLKAPWEDIEALMNADPMMSPYYNAPVHKSGRGAGGNCFIKDMAAFAEFYERILPEDVCGNAVFRALEEKNLELLRATKKNEDIVRGVYGEGA